MSATDNKLSITNACVEKMYTLVVLSCTDSQPALLKSIPGGRLPLLSTRSPSQLKNVTVIRPVPSYTAW